MSKTSYSTWHLILRWHLAALILLGGMGAAKWARDRHQFDRLMIEVAQQHEMSPRLISALVWKESRYRPDAVGQSGEIGLMQVTELVGYEWAGAHGKEDFRKEDLFDAEINLQAGTWYLAQAKKRWTFFDDPIPAALAEYNAGYANARRWTRKAFTEEQFINNITYPSTQRYVRDILKRYRGTYP